MALIHCPECRTKMSSVAKSCPKCGFSRSEHTPVDPEEAKLFLKRQLRDRMYRLKMFSFVAMSIAMFGALPMLWDYIRGIETREPIVLQEHWGMYAIGIGFMIYVVLRVIMILTKRNHIKQMKNLT